MPFPGDTFLPDDLLYPGLESAAARLYRRLAPLAKVDPGDTQTLRDLCSVLAQPGQIIDDLARARPGTPAWAAARDPDLAPPELLSWLAQHAGVTLPPGISVDEQRSRIKQAAGFYEGTTRAVREEIQRVLTGTRTVRVANLVDGHRFRQTIVTSPAETPDADAVVAAWLRQKPVGIVATHVVTDDVIWAEAVLTWDAVDPAVTWDTVALGDI